jgi:hypothetical protein
MFRCLPVVSDEGLRSYKAIAFIESIKAICYFKLGKPLQTVLVEQNLPGCFSENLGENIYG